MFFYYTFKNVPTLDFWENGFDFPPNFLVKSLKQLKKIEEKKIK